MKAIVVDPAGEDIHRYVELDCPEISKDDVLLDMKAATLNYRDVLIRAQPVSSYSGDARGRIAGSDGVGVASRLGKAVAGIDVGGRYMPSFFPDWLDDAPSAAKTARHLGGSVSGVMAQYIASAAVSLVAAPDHLSDEEAAALPCAGVTAWASLVMYGAAREGQTLLVQGTGGVSIFALQIAKLLGLRVIVTSSSDSKLARAKALGADILINYRSDPDWASAVLDATDGQGADHIIDIGGEATTAQSLQVIAMGGHLSLVGVLGGFGGSIDGLALRGRAIHIHTTFVESRSALQHLATFVERHRMRPIVDRSFSMAGINGAIDSMLAGHHFGKIAIALDG